MLSEENPREVRDAIHYKRVQLRVDSHTAVFRHGLRLLVQLFRHRAHTQVEGASAVSAHKAAAHLVRALKKSYLGHRLSSFDHKLLLQPRDEVRAADSTANDCEVKVELRW